MRADERDVVELRTNFRGEDVYVYRTKATGLIERRGAFEDAKAAAYLNERALAAAGRRDFSAAIRR